MAGRTEQIIDIIMRGFDDVSPQVRSATSSIDGAVSSFANLSKGIISAELAIAGIGAAMANAADEFGNGINKIQASLGISAKDAEKFGEIAAKAYTSGLSDSVEEGADAAILAIQKFGDKSQEELETITLSALKIQRVFKEDYKQAIVAAETLTKNFGISSNEAFDFITAGFQKGLNSSDDFIDSINEYAVQFKEGGTNASQFFSLLESGLQGGVFGTDKAADLFGEFRKRIQDGSKSTVESLKLIGLNSDEMAKRLGNGTMTVAEAFNIVIDRLKKTTDSSKVMQAGTGLLGTQFEDLGQTAVLSIDLAKSSIDDFAGKLQEMPDINESVIHKMNLAWREFTYQFSKTDLPSVILGDFKNVIDSIRLNFGDALKGVDFSSLIESIESGKEQVKEAFKNIFGVEDITTVTGLAEVIQKITDGFTLITEISTGIIDAFQPAFELLGTLAESLRSVDTESAETFGKFGGYAVLIKALGGPIGATIVAMNEFGIKAKSIGDIFGGLIGIIGAGIDNIKHFVVLMAADVSVGFAELQKDILETALSIAEGLGRLAPEGLADDIKRELSSISKEADKMRGEYDKAEKGITDNNEKIRESVLQMQTGLDGMFESIEKRLEPAAQSFEKVKEKTKELNNETKDLAKTTVELTDKNKELEKTQAKNNEAAEEASKKSEKRKHEIFDERRELESLAKAHENIIAEVKKGIEQADDSKDIDLFGKVVSKESAERAIKASEQAIGQINRRIQSTNNELGELYGHTEEGLGKITVKMIDGVLTFTGEAENAGLELDKAAESADKLAKNTDKAKKEAKDLANQFEYAYTGVERINSKVSDLVDQQRKTEEAAAAAYNEYQQSIRDASESHEELKDTGKDAFDVISTYVDDSARRVRTVLLPEIEKASLNIKRLKKEDDKEITKEKRREVVNIVDVKSGEAIEVKIKTDFSDDFNESLNTITDEIYKNFDRIDGKLKESLLTLERLDIRYESSGSDFMRMLDSAFKKEEKTLTDIFELNKKAAEEHQKWVELMISKDNKLTVEFKGTEKFDPYTRQFMHALFKFISEDAIAEGFTPITTLFPALNTR